VVGGSVIDGGGGDVVGTTWAPAAGPVSAIAAAATTATATSRVRG
jgi:hypothetical protein